MKKIDLLILRSFTGPFLLTFLVVVIFYVLQFFYTYIDDFVGKGLEWYVVIELIVYLSTNVIPLALPLAVLLSAIMAFGSLGERYELTAMKAAGIPLLRFIRGSVLLTILLAIGSLAFSNYVMPVANLKFYTTLIDITQAKPALDIKENVFFSGIRDFVIKIDKKGEDNRQIYGVYIADQSGNRPNNDVIIADSGQMFTARNGKFLVLKLYNGSRYERLERQQDNDVDPYSITHFSELEKVFDLSEFEFTRTSEDRLKDHYIMLNLRQLRYYIDSLDGKKTELNYDLLKTMSSHFGFLRQTEDMDSNRFDALPFMAKLELASDSLPEKSDMDTSIVSYLPQDNLDVIFNRAVAYSKTIKDRIASPILVRTEYYDDNIIKAKIEFHRKFMLAASCLVLLFIGASFGAIIRKGGIGYPVIFAVIFYVISYILLRVGEDMAKEGALSPFVGMWGGIMIMVPIAVFFTIKAKNDSSFLFLETYISKMNALKKQYKKLMG